MSGGVDSSVAAYLLKRCGYDCMGVTMKLFHGEDADESGGRTCCSLEDTEDARRVAYGLGIPHRVFNLTGPFEEKVVKKFITAYENGRTPNPCIDCNRYIKFEELFRRARELHYDVIATGHYAQVCFDESLGRYLLKKAADADKDQSYVLYTLTQEQLKYILFPLGELTKAQVRKMAELEGLATAKKRESQDICFVPDGNYAGFIERCTSRKCPPGNFLDADGRVIGRHRGIIHYTIGQRRGLDIALGKRVYVRSVDPLAGSVTLVPDKGLYSKALTAKDINLISVECIDSPMRCKAKIRYRQREQAATVTQTDGDTLTVEFDEPQRAITPGQAVVLYDGDVVIGGGTIQ